MLFQYRLLPSARHHNLYELLLKLDCVYVGVSICVSLNHATTNYLLDESPKVLHKAGWYTQNEQPSYCRWGYRGTYWNDSTKLYVILVFTGWFLWYIWVSVTVYINFCSHYRKLCSHSLPFDRSHLVCQKSFRGSHDISDTFK